MISRQCTDTILMIRPVNFRYNEQTAVNNYYQRVIDELRPEDAQNKAKSEFDGFANKLKKTGINVIIIGDTATPDTPDSIFPNNWISFHQNGKVALYPMYAPNRRQERRADILRALEEEHQFTITGQEDFTFYEQEGKFLEGTGSMILDRANRVAYAALSLRTNEEVLDEFCQKFGYEAVKFTANQTVNGKREPIYHTNVMMCIAEGFAILCEEAIDNKQERENVLASLEKAGKEIIAIEEEQKYRFAGNMLQVQSVSGEKFLIMSSAAYGALRADQIKAINKYCPIIHSSLDTIEALGGGSARCMMAEVFLPTAYNI